MKNKLRDEMRTYMNNTFIVVYVNTSSNALLILCLIVDNIQGSEGRKLA